MAMATAMASSTSSSSSSSPSCLLSSSSIRGQKLSLPSSSSSSFGCSRSSAPLLIQASKSIKGKVVCASSDKTVSVEVVRLYVHPLYKKRIKSSKKYHAHDEANACKVGDTVVLTPCRPLSKTKSFVVSEIVPKGKALEGELPPLESLIAVAAASSSPSSLP